MKLVRIDGIGPQGAEIELHPQLTVLRGVTPEFRRQFLELLDRIATGESFSGSGLVEVNGVHLSLDSDTIERLALDNDLRWVFEWPSGAYSGASERVSESPDTEADRPPPYRPETMRPDPLPELDALRERLRATAGERSALAVEMDQVRSRLDSFANAALEVCVGQIDALEARRSLLRDRFEADKSLVDEHLVELEAVYREHLIEIEAVESLRLDEVDRRRNRLASELEEHRGPDPASIELALRIDSTMRRVRDLTGRAAAVSLRRSEAEQRLAESVAEVAAAERSMQGRSVDPAVVARLEQVRDEMFAADERQSRLSVNRNRRRMASLRDEEARLLAQIGFETYSSYVMGIPSMRSQVERSARVDHARARVDEIQRELDSISLEVPSESLLAASQIDLRDLLRQASQLLSDPEVNSPAASSSEAAGTDFFGEPNDYVTDEFADDVSRVIERLRSRQLNTPTDGAPEVVVAADELRLAIVGISGGRFADPAGANAPRIAGSAIDSDSWNGKPSVLLQAVDTWLEHLAEPAEWLEAARASVEALREEIDGIRGSHALPTDVTEWAQVESELDTMLDRLAGAQERVRRHEDALVELAAMREQELSIRARERDLLAELADAEQELRDAGSQGNTGSQIDAGSLGDAGALGKTGADSTAASAASAASATDAIPPIQLADPADETLGGGTWTAEDLEWQLVAFAARRRSVSFAGSIPIVMMGLPAQAEVREVIFERLRRLGELVQMILIDDEDWLSNRVSSLGLNAKVIQF